MRGWGAPPHLAREAAGGVGTGDARFTRAAETQPLAPATRARRRRRPGALRDPGVLRGASHRPQRRREAAGRAAGPPRERRAHPHQPVRAVARRRGLRDLRARRRDALRGVLPPLRQPPALVVISPRARRQGGRARGAARPRRAHEGDGGFVGRRRRGLQLLRHRRAPRGRAQDARAAAAPQRRAAALLAQQHPRRRRRRDGCRRSPDGGSPRGDRPLDRRAVRVDAARLPGLVRRAGPARAHRRHALRDPGAHEALPRDARDGPRAAAAGARFDALRAVHPHAPAGLRPFGAPVARARRRLRAPASRRAPAHGQGRRRARGAGRSEEKATDAAQTPLVRSGGSTVTIGESDLTAQRIHVEKVRLTGLDVHVRRLHDGTLNLEHLAPEAPRERATAPARARAKTVDRTAEAAGPRFAVDSFELDKAALHVRDEAVEPGSSRPTSATSRSPSRGCRTRRA